MAYDIFISYSRQNSTSLANYLYESLVGRGFTVFMDVHRQDGGGLFPDHLKNGILDSTLFICLLSETTLQSVWVLQEIEIAYHAGKVMIPIFQERYIAPNPIPSPSVANLLNSQGQQYLDIKGLFYIEATQHLVQIISRTVPSRNNNKLPPRGVLSIRSRLRWIEEHPALTGLIGVLLTILITWVIAQQTAVSQPTSTSMVGTPSFTPPLNVNELVAQTITKQFEETAIAYVPTANALATETEIERQINLTETTVASQSALQKALDDAATAYWLTQTPYTLTPIQTTIPTSTFTATPTLEATQSVSSDLLRGLAFTATPAFTEIESVLQVAGTSRKSMNSDWEPYSHTFDDGIVRVLIPIGCFTMGNDLEAKYLEGGKYVEGVPMGMRQCFDDPFWLDKNEVSQYNFLKLGGRAGSGVFTQSNAPIFNVTWREAQAYCEKLGGNLPTEVEWEYAARGVESWFYPWGDEWDSNNAVWGMNSSDNVQRVGSRQQGNSWVGASDMAGNIAEWTFSAYRDYPYDPDDGREIITTLSNRVVRGGSWKYASAVYLRSASRVSNFEDNIGEGIGFRCAYPAYFFQSLTSDTSN